MQNLVIKETLRNPRIDFNPETGIFEIYRVSLIENTLDFYRPIIKWLEEYLKTPCRNTTIVFKLKYSNTSSLQFIYDIIHLIYLEHNKKNYPIGSLVLCF